MHLVPVEDDPIAGAPAFGFSAVHRRHREGFALTDQGTDVVGSLDQANYCIWCHNQGKDSCSTGLKEKTGAFKAGPFGVTSGRLSARRENLGDEQWPPAV